MSEAEWKRASRTTASSMATTAGWKAVIRRMPLPTTMRSSTAAPPAAVSVDPHARMAAEHAVGDGMAAVDAGAGLRGGVAVAPFIEALREVPDVERVVDETTAHPERGVPYERYNPPKK